MKKILTIIVLGMPILVIMGIAVAWQAIKNPSLNNENKNKPMLAQNQINNEDKLPSNGKKNPALLSTKQLMNNEGKKPVNEKNKNKSLFKPESEKIADKSPEKKNPTKTAVKPKKTTEKQANNLTENQVKSVKKQPINQQKNNDDPELTENNHTQDSTDDAPIPALW